MSTVDRCVSGLLALGLVVCTGCRGATAGADAGKADPVYNRDTGKLEQLASDRDGDGKVDTRAFMDGVRLKHIEIDRNADGQVDRWEFYLPPATASVAPGQAQLSHVEEAGAFDGRITRREFYQDGMVARVEEDTDLNGQTDKWEFFDAGILARVELDLVGKGLPTQRLVYRPDGNLDRVESDPEGTGRFTRVPQGKGGDRPQE